jgi:hypothetical protein
VGLCSSDVSADGGAIRRLAARAPHSELHEFAGDHFAPFQDPGQALVADSQVEFLRRTTLR